MAVTVQTAAETAAPAGEASVWPYRWTRERYERLVELGVLGPGDRVQLIEGEIVEMAPQRPPHATAVLLAQEALREAFGAGYHIRTQSPVALGDYSEPEPDVAVVAGHIRDYAQEHPPAALLAVEVADATLSFDRNRKASMYAKEGIQDYWIVNLPQRRLEVYRDPAPAPDTPYGYGYTTRMDVAENGQIAPLAAPDRPVKIADLLP
jgi:Uma2 family endonuclease